MERTLALTQDIVMTLAMALLYQCDEGGGAGGRFLVPQHETARPRASAVPAQQSRSKAPEPAPLPVPRNQRSVQSAEAKKSHPERWLWQSDIRSAHQALAARSLRENSCKAAMPLS